MVVRYYRPYWTNYKVRKADTAYGGRRWDVPAYHEYRWRRYNAHKECAALGLVFVRQMPNTLFVARVMARIVRV